MTQHVRSWGLYPGIMLCALTGFGSAACLPEDEENNFSVLHEQIINGDAPTFSSAETGVVGIVATQGGLPGCTGTLLTNRHVLTARHCVRAWEQDATGAWGWGAAGERWVLLEDASENQEVPVAPANYYEPGGGVPLDQGDYAIIELPTPMTIDGVNDGFYNNIYSWWDPSLIGTSVYCLGYGVTSLAEPGGQLRAAWLTVDSAIGGEHFTVLPNASGQIGFSGDSGSTCFWYDPDGEPFVTGVLSYGTYVYIDTNENEIYDSGEPITSVLDSTYVAPTKFRSWALERIMADIAMTYSFVPALEATTGIVSDISTPAGSTAVVFQIGPQDPEATHTQTQILPRGGWVEVSVSNEPPYMMCPTLRSRAPMTGHVEERFTCLGDGVVSALL